MSVKQRIASLMKQIFGYSNEPYYQIAEINISTQEIVFRIKHKSVLLKCKLSEAIANAGVVNGLSVTEACWLGGHFGRILRASIEGRDKVRKLKKLSDLLGGNSDAQCQIVCVKRNGDVLILDRKTNQEYSASPLTIARDDSLLTKLAADQACYIGILAGMNVEKRLLHDKALLRERPKLRLIK